MYDVGELGKVLFWLERQMKDLTKFKVLIKIFFYMFWFSSKV
jgi:hypothetical protein